MNVLHKVLVVDNGQRPNDDLLSTELAELGLSSVTTSLEATSDVLAVIDRPSAIILNMPDHGVDDARAQFTRLAADLRLSERTRGVPVIEWDRDSSLAAGGVTAILRAEVGPQAFSGPDL
jgi:hypothetical protein